MPRRIWVAEGVASDGDVYGRALQLPDGRGGGGSGPADTGVQRRTGTILKNHLGDIPSCPCLAALVPDERLRVTEAADA
ncbi:hypothetical protein HLK59_26200 [Streptomyces sp. S3(2020)]|uniref:hypothetical protein n=1 Tax=Streptomyces sp. S3(2020) TaxID=2732044 RepID=UPI0014896DEC|nr:hypothetical protein [Streptomyces sp. S3(2020)]NNN33794.1 hypothetical protein [Streptomyces sp. S3(2020)]